MKIEKRDRSRQLSRQSVEFRSSGKEENRRGKSSIELSRGNNSATKRPRGKIGGEDWASLWKSGSLSINLIIYDSWLLLAPSHFLPSLSTYKHRERNLIKYQSLFAIRVWPVGMLDTRPQFWISIGAYSVTGLKGRLNGELTRYIHVETVAALVVFTSFQSPNADVPIWIFKISNLNLFPPMEF